MIDFLVAIGLIWIIAACVTDIKKREVANWLSFSLMAFALVYRAFYALFNSDLMYFAYGVAGLGIFIGLGYLFYYARVFAGGDAKLLMSLGAVLPVTSISGSLWIFLIFIILLFVSGSFYSLIYSLFIAAENRKGFGKEFKKQAKSNKKVIYTFVVFALISLIPLFYLRDLIFLAFPALFLLFPLLFIYAKAVEESCMIMQIEADRLTEGDWLYKSVKFRGKIIRPYWEGLNSEQVKFLRRYKGKVLVKTGVPFIPAFLVAFVLLILLGVI